MLQYSGSQEGVWMPSACRPGCYSLQEIIWTPHDVEQGSMILECCDNIEHGNSIVPSLPYKINLLISGWSIGDYRTYGIALQSSELREPSRVKEVRTAVRSSIGGQHPRPIRERPMPNRHREVLHSAASIHQMDSQKILNLTLLLCLETATISSS